MHQILLRCYDEFLVSILGRINNVGTKFSLSNLLLRTSWWFAQGFKAWVKGFRRIYLIGNISL